MKVCLLNDSFPPLIDGVSNAVMNYAAVLTEQGDPACVVTPEYPGADDSAYSYPVLRYPGVDIRQIGYVAGYPFSPAVMRELELLHPEILHSHCPIASTIFARSLREKLNAPLILTYHTKFDVDIANAIKGTLLQKSAIAALVGNISACDEVWTVSEGAGQNLRSLGYQGDYLVMENGVDVPKGRMEPAVYLPQVEEYNLPADEPVFLFVGRLMWYKGLKIILDALSALQSGGIRFRMLMVGGGTEAEEIRAYTRQKGLEERVIFTGPIHDRKKLSALYCRADLFLFPSSFDTNGLVVREAAACSLPSVLIRGSCAAEGVIDGENGFLIDEAPESLAVLLTKLCIEYPTRNTMKCVGQNAADSLYLSWTDSVGRARERYGVVAENFRRGRYKKPMKPGDELFRLSGDLMDVLAKAEFKRGAE